MKRLGYALRLRGCWPDVDYVDWNRISEQAAWIVVNVAWPLSCGASLRELARELDRPLPWLERELERLRCELVQARI